MSVPRAKKKKPHPKERAFYQARDYLASEIFPNFIALTLMGVLDELDHGHMKNFHLTEGERARLIRDIADRIQHYCDLSNQGAIDPFDTRAAFEKSTGLDFSKIYIT